MANDESYVQSRNRSKLNRKQKILASTINVSSDLESSQTFSPVSEMISIINRNKNGEKLNNDPDAISTKSKKKKLLKLSKKSKKIEAMTNAKDKIKNMDKDKDKNNDNNNNNGKVKDKDRHHNKKNNKDKDNIKINIDLQHSEFSFGEGHLSPVTSESVTEMDFDCEGRHINFHDSFEMLTFLHKLRGTKFLPELRHFVCLTESNPNIISEFLKMSGKPIELVEALDRVNKRNIAHTSYICEAFQIVVADIITNHPVYKKSAINACQYMLKEHHKIIEDLLESFEARNRRIALKLLTSFVLVSTHVSKQTLATFEIFSNAPKLRKYFSNSKMEQSVQNNVRKCFIDFVMAFLSDDNILVIPNLLNRRAIIQELISGLLFDDSSTVCMVLDRLREFILENLHISKNTKIYVFDIECTKCLVRLYDWLGPQGITSDLTEKAIDIDAPLSKMKVCIYVNPEENEAVITTVHEFLLTLLTSEKYGINFEATSRPWQKHNAIQGKTINFIQKPWLSERKTALIHNVLRTSPECSRQAVCHFSKLISKYVSNSGEYVANANFLTGIIAILHPDLLRNVLRAVKPAEHIEWIKDICLPLGTLTALKNSNMLLSHNFECRFTTHRLLLAMITQYSNYMIYAIRAQTEGANRNMRSFKFDLYNHVLTHFPSVDHILQSLNMTMKAHLSSKLSASSTIKHLNVSLDLILVISKHNHSVCNITTAIIDYLKLIHPLYSEASGDEGDTKKRVALWGGNHHDINIELKAIKTILRLNPNALNSNPELFLNVVKSFIKIFIYGKGDAQRKSWILLKEIFKSAGIHDSAGLEVDLWLEALRMSDQVTVEVVTKVLLEVLKINRRRAYMATKIGCERNDSFSLSKLLPLVLESVRNVKPLDEFVEVMCLLLFHYHPNPACITAIYEIKFKTLQRYMRTWINIRRYSPECKDLMLPKLWNKIPKMKELQDAVLTANEETNFTRIFGCHIEASDSFVIEVENEKFRLCAKLKNERLLMIYVHQVMFLAKQLLFKQQLTRSQSEFGAQCIIIFLAILDDMEKENSADIDYVFFEEESDSIIHNSFLAKILKYIYEVQFACFVDADLCYVKSEHNLNYINFITIITKFCNKYSGFFNYAKDFRLKMYKAIAISIETVDSTKRQSDAPFIRLLDSFQLNAENCLDIIELLCKRLKYADYFVRTKDGFLPSFYYKLLVYLLQHMTGLQKDIDCDNIMKDLARYYVLFSKRPQSESDLDDYCKAFYDLLYTKQQCIQQLDPKVFGSLFTGSKVRKWNVKLACLLLQCNNNLIENFLNLLYENVHKRELIYPLMEIWFSKYESKFSIDKPLKSIIYEEYGGGLLEAIVEPNRADTFYREYLPCSIKLINTCMPLSECIDFCKQRIQVKFPFEHYQIRLVNAIYEKVWNGLKKDKTDTTALRTEIFLNYLNLQIQLLSKEFEQKTLMTDKLQFFAYQVFNWFTKVPRISNVLYYGFENIVKSQYWQNFCKGCVDFCMQMKSTAADATDASKGLILKFLAYLCNKLFVDHENWNLIGTFQPKEPVELFSMLCSHPNCYDILLYRKQTQVKTALLSLLYALAKKSPTLTLRHLDIPTLLTVRQSGYLEPDRFIVALMDLYEKYFPKEFESHRDAVENKKAISHKYL